MTNLESVAGDITTSQENLLKIEKLRFRSKNLADSNSCVLPKEKLDSLVRAQKNLLQVIQKLDDFLNAEKKLEDLKVLISDPSNFLLVQEKLDRLLELQKPFSKSSNSKFSYKLSETKEFEKEFYESVFEIFSNYLHLSIENPLTLKSAVKIILTRVIRETSDLKGSSVIMDTSGTFLDLSEKKNSSEKVGLITNHPLIKRMIQHIEAGTARRFDQNLGGKQELQDVLENIKFSIDDLLIIFEKTVPLFPKELEIFSVIEEQYKKNIDKKILPVLMDMGELKENPGFVIYLINWFHKYELLLQKVGFSSLDFSDLRAKIKDKLPIFYENVRNVFSTFLQNVTRDDPQTLEDLQLDEDFTSLDTQVPEDIASFLHQQLEFFVQNLSGDLFVKVFEIWKNELFLFSFTQSSKIKKNITIKEQIPLILVGKESI
jgi:hypothetical protein